MKKITTLIALFSTMCFTALAGNIPAKGYIAQAPRQQKDDADVKPVRNEPTVPKADEGYTSATWHENFSDEWEDETRTLQIKWGFPHWYEEGGMGETFLASQRRERAEDKFLDAFDDSMRYTFFEWFWQTPTGQAIEQKLEAAETRVELYLRRINGRGSEKRTTLDIIFGEKGKGWPDLGARIDQNTSLLAQWDGRGTGRFIINDNGEREEIMIEHEISWRVAKLTDVSGFTKSMYVAYEMHNIGPHRLRLKTRYDFESQDIKAFVDDIPLGQDKWLGFGITYHGDGNGEDGQTIFPLELEPDEFLAKPGSVTFTAGVDIRF